MFTPPTDSLYKFIAIFGLIILGWGVVFPWQQSYDYKLKTVELKSIIDKSRNNAELLKEKYQLLVVERKRIEQDKNDPEAALKKAAIDTKKQQLYIELLESQHPVDEKIATIAVLEEALFIYKFLGFFSIFFGLLLTISGFCFWYAKVQKHIDCEMVKKDS